MKSETTSFEQGLIAEIQEAEKLDPIPEPRKPRHAGFAKFVFKGIDIEDLLATPFEGFEEYMPERLPYS